MHFEFEGRPRIPFASLKVHVFQCCGPIRDLGTEPVFFFFYFSVPLRLKWRCKNSLVPISGLLLNVYNRLLERSRDNFLLCIYRHSEELKS